MNSIPTLALIRDTFREAFARRIFWGFAGCCTALLAFLVFIMRIDVVAGALATITIFGRAMPTTDVQGLVQHSSRPLGQALQQGQSGLVGEDHRRSTPG